ncbi:MAG: hypothetical protein ABGW74_05750 [Campylobacterales bacterium]
MSYKIMFPSIAGILLIVMSLFFLANPSYKLSLEAKYYYETSDYKEAYKLAKEAFELDMYNRMASTIMAQSKISLKYVDYIDMANKYMKTINEIATHDFITTADKAKIKTICEIMIGTYKKLSPSVITDKKLIDKVALYNKQFKGLFEKVTK